MCEACQSAALWVGERAVVDGGAPLSTVLPWLHSLKGEPSCILMLVIYRTGQHGG